MAELRVGRGPNGEALVGEQDLGITAVERQLLDAGFRVATAGVPNLVGALQWLRPVDFRRPKALGLLVHLGLDAGAALLGRHLNDAGQPVLVLRIDAVRQERLWFLHMAIR